MALIVMGSAKGAPGVSTTALALAAAWPRGARPVVWEADGDGSDLLHRFPVRADPGLVSLAGALGPEGLSTALVAEHTQMLPGGVPVMVGPPGAGAARAALSALGAYWEQAGHRESVWIVDLGRITAPLNPSAAQVLRAADAVVAVGTGDMAALTHTAQMCDQVRELTPVPMMVAVVGASQFSDGEIVEALRVDSCVRIAHDPASARFLTGGRPTAAPWWRHRPRYPLLEDAAELAHDLLSRFPERTLPAEDADAVSADEAAVRPSLAAHVDQGRGERR